MTSSRPTVRQRRYCTKQCQEVKNENDREEKFVSKIKKFIFRSISYLVVPIKSFLKKKVLKYSQVLKCPRHLNLSKKSGHSYRALHHGGQNFNWGPLTWLQNWIRGCRGAGQNFRPSGLTRRGWPDQEYFWSESGTRSTGDACLKPEIS